MQENIEKHIGCFQTGILCVSSRWIIWCIPVATIIYMNPVGIVWPKELFSDGNSGNHTMSYKSKWGLLGNLCIDIACVFVYSFYTLEASSNISFSYLI